jgi:Tfp pilus assembly protein PilV
MIEVIVTIMLVSIAIVGVLGGIRSLGAADLKAHSADLLQRLASQKMNDLKILSDPSDAGGAGDFTDRGYPGITWKVDVESTSIANVEQVTVTTDQEKEEQSLTTMVYVRPATGTVTAP